MTEESVIYTVPSSYLVVEPEFDQSAQGAIDAEELKYLEQKLQEILRFHRELVRFDNRICEIFKLSRGGYIKGKQVTVKELRRLVDKSG